MYLQDIESQKSKNSESKLRAAASRGLRNALYRMKGELSKALLLNVIQGWRQGSDATRRAADIAASEAQKATNTALRSAKEKAEVYYLDIILLSNATPECKAAENALKGRMVRDFSLEQSRVNASVSEAAFI